MESVVFIFALIDCCALIFLAVYFVSSPGGSGTGRARHPWCCGGVGVPVRPRGRGPVCGGMVGARVGAGLGARRCGGGGSGFGAPTGLKIGAVRAGDGGQLAGWGGKGVRRS